MCNLMGHPLNYEVGQACGDEVLYDALEFRVSSDVCILLWQSSYFELGGNTHSGRA